eukprot:CAMPEP_0170482958 /NCGR_PEP_ID=MMETSP0208-20121228/2745_1 /TAXON_ID=197538 /ORGANISM="Strombidium inclinatum, Strain S3" /LENGTH=72 /DNA_ID=CAMNT_0010755849 /DNA_START=210 /DNA_END=428 /DNA_ORIENTATION=+
MTENYQIGKPNASYEDKPMGQCSKSENDCMNSDDLEWWLYTSWAILGLIFGFLVIMNIYSKCKNFRLKKDIS